MPDRSTIRSSQVPRWALALAGVAVLVLLLVELGFPLSRANQDRVLIATQVVLWAGLAAEAWRVLAMPDLRRFLRTEWLGLSGTVLFTIALAGKPWLLPVLVEKLPGLDAVGPEAVYLGALQLAVVVRLAYRGLVFNQLIAFAGISPRLLLIGSFVGLILVGTLLLKLPRATAGEAGLSWIDSLFTSTSAVCVTGLIVVDTATAFSGLGKTIILVLFQIGGLGLMTFAYFLVSVFRGVTLKDRTLLLEFLNEDNAGRITHTLVAIVVMTLAFEATGALLLHTAIETAAPGSASWFDSVFHSVSAFCNAGFSSYTLGLFDLQTRDNLAYQCTIMALIVVGGLGFPVLKNLWERLWSYVRAPRHRPARLTTHTRLVLTATAILLTGGSLFVYFSEFALSDGNHWPGEPLPAIFLSVTARTAGFNTTPTEMLAPVTAAAVILLMFIGGGPAGTAGGIKVSTLAIAILNTLRTLRGAGGELVAFGRRIPDAFANRAFAIVLLAVVWVSLTTLALLVLMPTKAPLDVLFEAVSAFATVGLSRGITAELPGAAKLIIVASMIVGRIGILYVAIGVAGSGTRARVSYPEANVIIS